MSYQGFDTDRQTAVRPNLFVVGAMKAGTTTLHRLLSGHPDVFMSPVKEPNFFADPEFRKQPTAKEKARFAAYLSSQQRKVLHSAPVASSDEYVALFRDGYGRRYLGEASPSYLHSIESPERIAKFNSDARILVILREPIERAYSHYRMDVTIGRRNIPFEEAVQRELDGEQIGSGKGYLAMSRYAEALERWHEAFPRNQIMVMTYSELFLPTGAGLAVLAHFLQLDHAPFGGVNERHNRTKAPRFARLNYLLQRSGAKHLLREFLPESLKEAGKRRFYSESRGNGIPDGVREHLSDYFAPDILASETLLGRDLFVSKG